MRQLISAMLLIVGVIHLLPLTGVAGASQLLLRYSNASPSSQVSQASCRFYISPGLWGDTTPRSRGLSRQTSSHWLASWWLPSPTGAVTV